MIMDTNAPRRRPRTSTNRKAVHAQQRQAQQRKAQQQHAMLYGAQPTPAIATANYTNTGYAPPGMQRSGGQNNNRDFSRDFDQDLDFDPATTADPLRPHRPAYKPRRTKSRVDTCSCCHAIETPVWRKGNNGRVLCNACGMRWIKYGVACDTCHYVANKHESKGKLCTSCGKAWRADQRKLAKHAEKTTAARKLAKAVIKTAKAVAFSMKTPGPQPTPALVKTPLAAAPAPATTGKAAVFMGLDGRPAPRVPERVHKVRAARAQEPEASCIDVDGRRGDKPVPAPLPEPAKAAMALPHVGVDARPEPRVLQGLVHAHAPDLGASSIDDGGGSGNMPVASPAPERTKAGFAVVHVGGFVFVHAHVPMCSPTPKPSSPMQRERHSK